ncbi:hypothetical protein FACS18942_07430 [Planctomycetales bacterium]|nr:hypothetical protein FACS18942_07430 [Planctomycetales bacterium]
MAKFLIPTSPYVSEITYADTMGLQKIYGLFPKGADGKIAVTSKEELLEWVKGVYKRANNGKDPPSSDIRTIVGDVLKNNASAAGKINPPSNKDILDYFNKKKEEKTVEKFLDFIGQTKFRDYAKSISIRGVSQLSAPNGTYIQPLQYEEHVQQVQNLGFSLVQAKWLVYDYVRFKTGEIDCVRIDTTDHEEAVKILNETTAETEKALKKLEDERKALKKQRPCPECNELCASTVKVCLKCGTNIVVECPKCKKECYAGDRECSDCGFNIGIISIVSQLERDCREAIKVCNLSVAREKWRAINTTWEGPYPKKEELDSKIEEVKIIVAVSRKIIAELKTEIGKRNFYKAKEIFDKIADEHPHALPQIEDEQKKITDTLTDVRIKLAQLPTIADIAKKIDICEEIIAVAADCREAQDALAKYPPMPPSNLSAKVNTAGSVDLTWTSPASRKPPMFVVVRKTGGVPASPTDGQTVTDNLSNTTFTDSTCEIGEIYGYTVFTKRDKVCDQNGCRLQQPVRRIGELEDIKVLPADRGVTFSWAKPANCIGIQITRYKSGSTQGTKLPLQQEMGLTDSGLINDTDYTYLFQSVFHTAEKKTVETAGVKRTVKPQLPPPAVQDLTADTADGMTGFQWTPPSRGEVLLFNLASEPDIQPGQTEADTPLKLKEKYGEPLPILNPKQGQTS